MDDTHTFTNFTGIIEQLVGNLAFWKNLLYQPVNFYLRRPCNFMT